MRAVKYIALGGVGIAALVGATAPAAAQYYPGYGQQPGAIIAQVLQSVINPYGGQYGQYGGQYGQQYGGQYGQQYGYGMNTQMAAQQCTNAVQQRLQYRGGYGNQYGGQYGGYAGQYGYNNAYSQARVLGITRVEQRSASTLRVRGLASSGMTSPYYPGDVNNGYGGYPGSYGAYGGYGAQGQPADLSFKCDVDYRGYVRDVDIDRRR